MQMFFMCNNIMGCADMYISEIQYTENRAHVMAPPSNGVFMGISTDEVVPVRVLLTGVKAEASMLIVSKCMAHGFCLAYMAGSCDVAASVSTR